MERKGRERNIHETLHSSQELERHRGEEPAVPALGVFTVNPARSRPGGEKWSTQEEQLLTSVYTGCHLNVF